MQPVLPTHGSHGPRPSHFHHRRRVGNELFVISVTFADISSCKREHALSLACIRTEHQVDVSILRH